MNIGEILKDLRNEKGVPQQTVADYLGISKQGYGLYETGKREPNHDTLIKLCEFFDVTMDFLFGISNDNSKAVRVPVLGKVQAGIPIEAIEEIIDYEEITKDTAAEGEYFGLVVRGNSMEPKFSDGDVVIVRKQPDVDNGEIAIVLINGEDSTMKKIKKTNDGVMLIPNNPDFDVIFYSNKEIIEKNVTIIGKVVELRAKF